MKKLSLIIISLVFLTSCGGAPGACDALPFLGSWYNAGTAETMTFSGACRFTSDLCASTGTFPPVTGASGNVLITVDSTSGAGGCLPLGGATCAYVVDTGAEPDTLAVDCGSGAVVFTKN